MWIIDDCWLEPVIPIKYKDAPPGPKTLAKHRKELYYKVGYKNLPNDRDLPTHLPEHIIKKLSNGMVWFKYFGNTICLEPIAYKLVSFEQMVLLGKLSRKWSAEFKKVN